MANQVSMEMMEMRVTVARLDAPVSQVNQDLLVTQALKETMV
jgi:hypothetical protein